MKLEYEYIEDYKGRSIYQDMSDGYYIALAYDENDKLISREGTLELVKHDIDSCKENRVYKIGDKIVIMKQDIQDLPTTLGTITNILEPRITIKLDNSHKEVKLWPKEIRPREGQKYGKF